MKKLSLIFFSFLGIMNASAQSSILFTPTDSLFLESTIQWIGIRKNHMKLFLLNYDNAIVFDTKGQKIQKLKFSAYRKKGGKIKQIETFVYAFQVIPHKHQLINNKDGYVSVFDSTGLLRLATEIWNKKHYKTQWINGVRVEMFGNFMAHPTCIVWKDTMINPLRAIAFIKIPKAKAERKALKYDLLVDYLFESTDTMEILPSYPLFNLYRVNFDYSQADGEHPLPINDPQGSRVDLIRSVGTKDSIWSKTIKEGSFYPYAQEVIYAFDSVRKHIIAGNSIFPQMKVYDFSGNTVKTFGERGKHTVPIDTPFKIVKKELIDSLKKKSVFQLQRFTHDYQHIKLNVSLSYGNIVYDAIHNRTYRTYYRPVPYSEGELWQMANGKEELREKFNDSLRLMRPCYLQIYDHNDGDRLIYDERVPAAPFYILEVKGDTLWAVAGTTDKGLKIVKYVLRPRP